MNLEKIDKFYVILALVLIAMAVMVIFSFRGIFNAFLTANEIDQQSVGKQAQLDREKLDEAYSFVFDRNPELLLVRD